MPTIDSKDVKTTDSTPAGDALADIAKAAAPPATSTVPNLAATENQLPSESTVGLPANNELISAPAADAAPASKGAISTAPAVPVVLSDKDITASSDGQSNEKMAEEIEVLTGEIQALEAKIEGLTGGAVADITKTESPLPVASLPPINNTEPAAAPITQPMPKPEPAKPEAPIIKEDTDAMINKPANSNGTAVPINTVPRDNAPVGDLYSDIKRREQEAPTPQDELKEQSTQTSSSGLAIISEVIAVFGLVLFVILAVSPFFREILGDDTYLAVQQIGWLSSLGTLGLGFLLMLFSKGRGMFKILLLIFLLLAAVLFLALGESSLISPISSYLEPLIQFYR